MKNTVNTRYQWPNSSPTFPPVALDRATVKCRTVRELTWEEMTALPHTLFVDMLRNRVYATIECQSMTSHEAEVDRIELWLQEHCEGFYYIDTKGTMKVAFEDVADMANFTLHVERG